MKIVEFQDGRYGVRKFTFLGGWMYLDMCNFGYWWNRDSRWFHNDCRGTREQAQRALAAFTDKGKPVQ